MSFLKELTISAANESLRAELTRILPQTAVLGINVIHQSVFKLERLRADFAGERLVIGMLNFLVIDKTLFVDRRIVANITKMSQFAVNGHVFPETNFVLEPFVADRTFDLKLKVLVRGQMIREITFAVKLLRANFTTEFLSLDIFGVNVLDVNCESTRGFEFSPARVTRERCSNFFRQVRCGMRHKSALVRESPTAIRLWTGQNSIVLWKMILNVILKNLGASKELFALWTLKCFGLNVASHMECNLS